MGKRMIAASNGSSLVTDFTTDRLQSKGDGSRFYPYGESKTGASGDDREQFATYTRDERSGLDYADQRWYASGVGRFGSVDPTYRNVSALNPTSWNRYAYSNGDSINANDPDGLATEVIGQGQYRSCYGTGEGGDVRCYDWGWNQTERTFGERIPISGSDWQALNAEALQQIYQTRTNCRNLANQWLQDQKADWRFDLMSAMQANDNSFSREILALAGVAVVERLPVFSIGSSGTLLGTVGEVLAQAGTVLEKQFIFGIAAVALSYYLSWSSEDASLREQFNAKAYSTSHTLGSAKAWYSSILPTHGEMLDRCEANFRGLLNWWRTTFNNSYVVN